MANNLTFGVKIDLQKGVEEALKDSDKYLRRLENTLRQKPIRLDVAINNTAPGSLDAIRNRMDAVVKEFNKLTEAQRIYNRTSGEFTPEAQKLIKEYAELTAATQTYAQSLSQITNAAKRQTEQQIKAQQQEIKRYEEYWKRKEAENAKQAQQDIANAERSRKAQQQRITQEQAADTKRYQEWLRQKNQEAIETERVERQKQQSRERTIAQQNREYAAQRQAEAQRQQAISASLRAEYQRIEAKRQAELASRRELQQLNQMYAAEERRQRLAASEASIAKRQKVLSVLRAEENTIVNITAKLQHWQQVMNSSDMGGRQFKRATEEVKRLTAELEKAQARVANATATASSRQSAAVRQVNQEFRDQDGYISRLIKRMAVYASFSYMSQFLTNVREVTAQFELQRISLGAIIQDQNRANQLFSEIKSFALQSPVSILDLTKYTKQLAAYKFETEELFDWTKRLTDISVGLSVPMERIVLLAGQVRATGFLRGCLGKGTIVVMLDGSKKKVEDIEVGDIVMGDDERGRNVLSLIHNREMMYVVKYDSGTFRCNENHILTVFNQETNQVEDVYILEYLRSAHKYKGIRRINSHYEYFDMTIERDCVDDYYGFEIDDNKRFIIEDNIVTHNSEVRQATEAGIPLVEELAAKLTKMNGEMVTAAEVMDMISKRAISWEMVADIFKDMTSAGGTFYNMQEKQGNTLFGLWAKLGDAASVMYEEIGNTDDVNKGMKNAIQLLTELMRNWKAVANTAAWVVAPTALTAMFTKYALSSTRKQAADAAATAATERRKAAVLQLSRAIEKGSVDDINAANATLQKAKADEIAAQKAATKTGLMASGFKSIASSMAMGLGIGLAVTAVTALAYKLFEAYENAHRLKNKLKEIDAERIIVTEQSVRNFEYLADAAIKAADGSKEQKDKLDELHRTFKDMIPVEDMSIENLRKLRSGADSAAEGYKSLTESIRNYIAQQQKQKALGAIEEEFGAKRITAMKNLYDWFDKQGLGVEERTRFFAEFEKQAQDTSKSLKEQIVAAFNEAGIEGGEELANSIAEEKGFWNKALEWFGKNQPLMFGTTAIAYKAVFPKDGYINDLANATRKYNEEVSGTLSYYEGLEGTLGKYTKAMEDAKKHMADFIPQGFKSDTFAYQQEVNAEQIRTWGGVIVDALKAENIKIENEWFNIDNDKAFNIADIATINIQAIKDALGSGHGDIKKLLDNIAKGYNEIVPKDAVVRSVRSKFEELADSMGLIDKVRGNMMGATEGLEAYRKKINDTAKDYAKQVENLTKVLAATPVISLAYKEIADKLENAKDLEEFYSKMAEILGKSTSGGGGRQSDPRLQILNDIANKMAQINKEYDELLKKEGQTKALADTQKLFASSFADMQKVADKYKFKLPAFEVPQAIEDVQKWYKAVMNNIKRLKLKNADKVLIELGFKSDKAAIDQQQKNIEAKLKALADRISRTKTAKEFYEKILSQTGDVELAAKLSVSVYGQDGGSLQREIASQLSNALKGVTADGQTIGSDVFEEGVIDPNTLYINYTKLREIVDKQGDKLSDSQKKILDEMLKNGEAYNKAQVEQWAKDLAKVKDFTDQYIDLYRMTEKRKAEIRQKMASGELGEDAGKQEIAGYDARLVKEQSKIQYEMFKNSPMYTSLFENMENATVQSLHNMRSQIEKMMAVTKEPTQLKELQNRLNEIDETLAEKSPFEVIAKGWQTMGKMAEKYGSRSNLDNLIKQKQDELDALQAELDAALEKEAQTKQFAEMMGVDVQNPTTAITPVQKAALAAYQQASADVKKYGDAVKKADNEQQKLTSDATKWANAMGKVKKGLKTIIQIGQNLLKASEAAQEFAEALGMSEDGLELFQDINNVISNTLNFADALIGCIDLMAKTTAQSISTVEKASVILTVISAALQVATAIFNLFGNAKVRKANKEIERQQELLDQLEYTYGRLEKAADKLFGADFVANQKQQQKILLAQQQAYMKQYEAEMSKGKKADKEKAQEFLDKARDVGDQIADMQGKIAEQMAGTDVASAARDFASAWLEAYASFGNTTDAIREKFNDMIKNMIVESVMAKTVQMALQPMFDEMDKMYKSGASMTDVLSYAFSKAGTLTDQISNGLEVNAKYLESLGINIRDLYASSDNLKGIAKEVGSASSEEINQLSAFVNTALYYVSPIPTISENVSLIRQLMERGTTSTLPDTTAAGWTDWQQQAMDNYKAIAANTAATVVECRRAANACETSVEKLGRIITSKGSVSGVNVFMKG